MSSVRKQGIWFSLFSYIGVILSYVNLLILFPSAMSPAEFGFTRWIIYSAGVLGILAQMGLPSIAFKYFPYFKNKEKAHHNFAFFLLLMPIVGIVLVSLALFFFQENIVQLYDKPESYALINQYYWLVLPVLIALTLFNTLQSYVYSFGKTAITAFLRDILNKVGLSILLLGQIWGFWGLNTTFFGFVGLFLVQTIGLIIYLFWIGEFRFDARQSIFPPTHRKEIAKYGLITMLSGSTIYLISIIDQLMVSVLTEGQFEDTGIYNIFYNVSLTMLVPYRAVLSAAIPKVATASKENNTPAIALIYRRSAEIMGVLGVLLFVLIVANLNNIVAFLGAKYAAGAMVAIFIGLSNLFNIASSVNGVIISQSNFYRFDLYFSGVLVVFTIVSNLIFIPIYGMIGAAVATMLVSGTFNLLKVLLVYWKLKIQPFSLKTFKTILLGIFVIGIHFVLPEIGWHWLADLIYRSLILTFIYGIGSLYFELSPDINQSVQTILTKVKRLLG